MRTIVVTVTEDHITASRRVTGCNSKVFTPERYCPIAIALRTGEWKRAHVGATFVCDSTEVEQHIEPANRHTLVFLPAPAVEFIKQFDAGNNVSPLTFELQIREPGDKIKRGSAQSQQPAA